MNMRNVVSFLAALVLLAGAAFAQDQSTQRPRFEHPIPHYDNTVKPAATALQTWNGTFTYQGHNNAFVMVGTDPSSTNTSTTVTAYIIPVRATFVNGTTKTVFDPSTKLSSGNSVTKQTGLSPIFQNIDYNQGGTDLGTTQYEDAFQRGNFWTDVMTNTNYHVKLKPIVLPEMAITVPTSQGTTGKTGTWR